MTDINELRRLAQAATQHVGRACNYQDAHSPREGHVDFENADLFIASERPAEDAAFYAAANPAAITELLDRLEAAEKSDAQSIAMYRKARDERDALRAAVRHEADCVEAAKAEIEAMRAKIEQQEPVAWTTKLALEYGASRLGFQVSGVNIWGENGVPLYALPGAQPAPSVPEGFALVNAAHFLAVLDREDWRTAKNRAELRAMLAAAPEAKP